MENTVKRAFLFDMDGTLSDTEILWVPTTFEYLKDLDRPVEYEWALKTVYGRAWSSIYKDIIARFPDLSSISCDEMADQTHVVFERLRATADIRIPGSVECVRACAKLGPCAIVSGSFRGAILEVVKELGLEGCFQAIISSEDISQGKPSPEGFLKGAALLGVSPAQCVVFEDSHAGIAAARSAGMSAVALVLPGHPVQDVSAAHLQLSNLQDFDLEKLDTAVAARSASED